MRQGTNSTGPLSESTCRQSANEFGAAVDQRATYTAPMTPGEVSAWGRLEALPPGIRAELLHVLMLPDFDRADRIGEFWG
jgi:hypothetical protein